jgi:hypothetical protein
MNENPVRAESSEAPGYEAPTVELISLDCEISSYAPDEGDVPLF